MKRLTTKDYAVDAVTAAKALLGAWLCRRFDGIAYAAPRDQKRKWRFTVAIQHFMRKRQVAACIQNGRECK